MNAKGNPNDWHIEVYPRRAGNFGYMSISGVKYNEREAENLQNEIQEQIKRHTDNVQNTDVVYDRYLCGKCGNDFNTEGQAEECCNDEELCTTTKEQ